MNTMVFDFPQPATHYLKKWHKPDVVRPIPDALVCCPVVETALVQSFYIGVNIVCKKKVTTYSGELTTTCQNPRCKRKMLLQRCKQAYLVELTLTNADGNQEIYTVFPERLKHTLKLLINKQ